MKRTVLLVFISMLCLNTYATVEYPGCNVVCYEGKACGDACIPKEDACWVPIGVGHACDATLLTEKEVRDAKCCQGRGGVCGCAGDQVICCDAKRTDECGCKFSLIFEDEC